MIVQGLGSLNPTVRLLRGGGLLWVVDGFPLATNNLATLSAGVQGIPGGGGGNFPGSNANPSGSSQTSVGRAGSTSLAEVMTLVAATDVEKIELLVGADAAFYGSRASGGVIMIYTRSGSNQERIMRKEAQLVFQGYESDLDFEAYLENKSRKAKQAINTLYWNPEIQTDEEGIAVVKLNSSDTDGDLYIKASTITTDGRIGVYESVLQE